MWFYSKIYLHKTFSFIHFLNGNLSKTNIICIFIAYFILAFCQLSWNMWKISNWKVVARSGDEKYISNRWSLNEYWWFFFSLHLRSYRIFNRIHYVSHWILQFITRRAHDSRSLICRSKTFPMNLNLFSHLLG